MKELTTVLFGSTGLVGKQVFKKFLFPEWHLFLLQEDQVHFTHHLIVFTRREIDVEDEIQDSNMIRDLFFENYTFSYSFHDNVISYFFQNKITGQIVTSKIVVEFVIESQSEKWKYMLADILLRKKRDKERKIWDFSIISCLGSTARQSKNSGVARDWVENTLNQDLLTAVVENDELCGSLKQFVVITSFNNKYFSKYLPYFKTKAMLETGIKNQLKGKNVQITILKPGPLLGSHGNVIVFKQPELRGSLLGYFLNFKKSVIRYSVARIQEIPRVGLRTKGVELIAAITYKKPGSHLIGCPVKSSDVAQLIVYSRLVYEKSDSSFAKENRIIEITSEDITKIVQNNTLLNNIY